MPATHGPTPTIATPELLTAAQSVIRQTLDAAEYPATLSGKLGTAEHVPLADAELASRSGGTARDISDQFTIIKAMLLQADRILGAPLASISQRTNDAIAAAGINNRSGRRRSYTEKTLQTLIRLGLAQPEHLPVIRAAGYAYPPPDITTDLDLRALMADVADHITQSDTPQTIDEILQGFPAWDGIIDGRPELNMVQCISQHARILPDSEGRYGPDQRWRRFLTTERLVRNTVVRVLRRAGRPTHLSDLTREVNTTLRRDRRSKRISQRQVQDAIIHSDLLDWDSPATCRLTEWPERTGPVPETPTARTITQRIHQYLTQHGPMSNEEIRETFGRNIPHGNIATGRTDDDLNRRFLRLPDRRVAALPFPLAPDRPRQPISVIPDPEHDPGPRVTTIFVSELHWLNQFAPHLADLDELGLLRVAVTGPRAAGAASARVPMEITIVVDGEPQPLLQQVMTQAAERANRETPTVRPTFTTIPHQDWAQIYEGDTPRPYHDIWRSPGLR